MRKGLQDGVWVSQSCNSQTGPSAQLRYVKRWKRDTAHRNQHKEKPHGPAQLCGAAYRNVPPSLLRAQGETPNHPQEDKPLPSCGELHNVSGHRSPQGKSSQPPEGLSARRGGPPRPEKGCTAEQRTPPRCFCLPPARSTKKVRDPYVGSSAGWGSAGAAAPGGSANTGLGAASWAMADSCVPTVSPASGAGTCSAVVSTSTS